MRQTHFPLQLCFAVCLAFSSAKAAPVINEIMYRPGAGYPENTALEFIEIHNPEAVPVHVGGWALTTGVNYIFPAGTAIAAGGYVVVAANPTALGVAGALGPWEAGDTLSDKGEKITLVMPNGTGGWQTVDSVSYADEGDWAVRNFDTTNGWTWNTGANGAGRSLERRNPNLASDNGQNFGDSAAVGGSPGAVNALLTANIAPVIADVKHTPAVPKSTESVTISCEIKDELAVGSISATLYWRNVTTTSPGVFQTVAMTGNAAGVFTATLGSLGDKQIVEYYVSATDGTLTRTWPATTSAGQTANCQYQVDNEVIAGITPAYRLVFTASELAAYTAVAANSDRQFNFTLVASSGDDTTIRHRCAIRNRGNTSRNWAVRPARVSIPTDDRWGGTTDFMINSKYPWCQFIGMRGLQAAGLASGDSTPVEVRRNGVEPTMAGTTGDYGKLVRIDDINGDYIDRHWPTAAGGQAYRATSMSSYWVSTGATPTNPNTVWNGWTKENASGLNDWTDIANFSTVWQNTALSHFTGATAGNVTSGTWNNVAFTDTETVALSTVADLNQIARYLAVQAIFQNTEANISTGASDDYAVALIQNALGQRRLNLIPHDLDNMLGKGDTAGAYNSTGIYDPTETGAVFEPLQPLLGTTAVAGNAAFRTKYLTTIRELYGSIFDADTSTNAYPPFYAFIDNHLSDWLPAAVRTELKTFATQRQAHLLGQIGAAKIVPTPTTNAGTFTTTYNGALRINEVLASNVAAYANGTTFPDVIELRNTGASAADLSGMSLSDEASTPLKYVFPNGTSIASGGFLLVFADTATAQPGLHTGFELDANGDNVRLYASVANGGAVIDQIVFGPQAADRSIARTAADASVWALTLPTVNATNGNAVALGAIASVKINEWAGNTDFRLNWDFVELHNAATLPVNLAGVNLTDDAANYPTRQTFPALSFIGASSRLLLKEDNLAFKIDASFGYLTLTGANGALIDQVSIISQFGDRSTGRTTDGVANTSEFAIASPGIANQVAPAAYSALVVGLRITEMMYQPNGGGAYEFIELQNIGATTLDLSGVRFTDGIDYTFASGATLAAGAYVVVCKDRPAFLGRYPAASSVLAEGAFTGAMDNYGETLALTLPAPWDVNILKFRYEATWYPATAGGGYSLTTASQTTSLPKDWDESFIWTASSVIDGTPGSDGPPSITSATTASGVLGDAFAYQITATKTPTSYSASGLPAGLSVNTSSGLISGTPTVEGIFNTTVFATNPGGNAQQPLTITIATSGALHHLTWNYGPPATANVNTPFPVRITARDSAERMVTTHTGSATLAAATAGGGFTGSPIVITEATDGQEDQIELQNVTNATVNAAGWYVKINDATTSINTVNANVVTLSGSLAASGLVWISEQNAAPRVFWPGAVGNSIAWSSTGTSKGWIMLFDATNTLRDFFIWGWTSPELATLNVTINGTNVTAANCGWSGVPQAVFSAGATTFWARTGTADNNVATDFSRLSAGGTFNATNGSLTLPWSTSTPVTMTPTNITLTNGEFFGYLTMTQTATTARITGTSSGVVGQTGTFDILAALADTDGDGIPDAWENANGLNAGANDASGDLDSDGQTNRAEFSAGTAANSPASLLAFTSESIPGTNQFTVTWPAVAGKLYRISTSPDLAAWTNVAPLILATTTGPKTVTLDTGVVPSFFVRVQIAP